VKTDEQRRARELRALGWSIKEIERHLGVARSSVSLWVRDVSLDAAARERLARRVGQGPIVAAELKAARARLVRQQYQMEGRLLAVERGAQYRAGCMLYWCEGAKGRHSVRLTNSDPELTAVFVEFLREEFQVSNDRFRVRLNLFADHAVQLRAVEDKWLGRLNLPRDCLRSPTINNYSKYSQKKRANKLPYGTCELAVHCTRIVQTIYGSIQEYGGFDRPEWLD
jgi:transcriptional regulator with XRE-family HTH domain